MDCITQFIGKDWRLLLSELFYLAGCIIVPATKAKFDYEKNLYKTPQPYKMETKDLSTLRLRYCIESFPEKEDLKVIEIGCGQAAYIATIASIKNNSECYGFDISKAAIKNASRSHNNVYLLAADAQRIPFADKYFDVVIIFDVLEHLEDVRATLKEAKRILKDDGVFHCHVPCEGETLTWTWIANKIHIGNTLKYSYAGHIQQFKKKDIINLIEEQFTIKRVHYSFHFLGQISDLFIYALKYLESKPFKNLKLVSYLMKKSWNIIKKIRIAAYNESLFLKDRSLFALALHIDAAKSN